MKVLMPNSKVLVCFEELKPGEVFQEPSTSDPFMVVYADDELDDHSYNAVDLKSGELMLFGDRVMVARANAVLHINC